MAMDAREEEFLQRLRATFRVEAAEHLQAINAGLLELERTGDPAAQHSLIETVFRAAHSLKGAARAVNLTQIELVCQSLESLFASWKRGEGTPTTQSLDTAHGALDQMSEALLAPTPKQPPTLPVTRPLAAAAVPASAVAPETETVRIAVASLDKRLQDAEELLVAKLAAHQRVVEISEVAAQFEAWHREWNKVHGEVRRLADKHDGIAAFLEWNHDYVRDLESRIHTLRLSSERGWTLTGKLIDELLENSKKLLLLPLSTLAPLLTKIVRDLARNQDKEADLVIRGGEVEIDKRVLEEMKDPLIHLLRNAVDHGIESSQMRLLAGKAARGTISLSVAQLDGSKVELLVRDDGNGIDVAKVKATAVRKNIVSAEAAELLDDASAAALIFESELSTSPMITRVSGRGLGLAIVREKAEKLGGRVALENAPQQGLAIRITLPLTLATFRGILIESGKRLFVLPTAQVERALRFKNDDVRSIEGRETLSIEGRAVALVSLATVLGITDPVAPDAGVSRTALILGTGEQRLAFSVDLVVDEREVLVKPFTKPLARVRNLAGATILASGELVPILNVADLLKSGRTTRPAQNTVAPPARAEGESAPAVLIAEDSITSRMLIKGILESAGYRVKTAVDGLEAFAALRAEAFDILVSDVEMPRLNGFDLTARIRADRRLAELPVILVTALESREDREHGIDVGANAYLVKSDFDQSDLLDALRRLL